MKKQIEELTAKNTELQKQLLDSQIDNHFIKNNLSPEMLRPIKILASEQAVYSDDGKRTFEDANGKPYHDMSIWIDSLAETEKLPLKAQATEAQAEQPTRLCKNDMSESQKREYKSTHGYDKYNALPLINVA